MEHWQGVINAKDVAKLYNNKINQWLLLEVIKMGKNRRAEEFKLVAFDKNKEKLKALMEDDDWDWDKKYMFVFADPNSLCEIGG
ncbi:MAG: hypothetical protein L3J06_00760 [Cyclobacteriaceae bacterium]|nr:hypothetical protein [Cyclobacteriaceae bacterium]